MRAGRVVGALLVFAGIGTLVGCLSGSGESPRTDSGATQDGGSMPGEIRCGDWSAGAPPSGEVLGSNDSADVFVGTDGGVVQYNFDTGLTRTIVDTPEQVIDASGRLLTFSSRDSALALDLQSCSVVWRHVYVDAGSLNPSNLVFHMGGPVGARIASQSTWFQTEAPSAASPWVVSDVADGGQWTSPYENRGAGPERFWFGDKWILDERGPDAGVFDLYDIASNVYPTDLPSSLALVSMRGDLMVYTVAEADGGEALFSWELPDGGRRLVAEGLTPAWTNMDLSLLGTAGAYAVLTRQLFDGGSSVNGIDLDSGVEWEISEGSWDRPIIATPNVIGWEWIDVPHGWRSQFESVAASRDAGN